MIFYTRVEDGVEAHKEFRIVLVTLHYFDSEVMVRLACMGFGLLTDGSSPDTQYCEVSGMYISRRRQPALLTDGPA